MGIRGLKAYVNDPRKNLWRRKDLQDTEVIIDGNSFLYNIQRYNDFQYGGQYDQTSYAIEQFFSCLKAKNINPYVVFDGPTSVMDKKLDTRLDRVKQKMTKCDIRDRLSKGNSGNNDVVNVVDPPLTKMLLIKKLKELGVGFHVCVGEADKEIAILAKERSCPVMSGDSDFFIYDIPDGYIHFPDIHCPEDLVSVFIYHRRKLAKHLGIKEDLLPLLASLLGNDYVSKDVLKPFDQALGQNHACIDEKIENIQDLLQEHTAINEAMKSVLGVISEQGKRSRLKEALEKSLDEYKTDTASIASQDIGSSHGNIPPYVVKKIRTGDFPLKYISAILFQMQILKCQVEDMSKKSSNDCSKRLRQRIYGILMPQNKEITEWGREGSALKKFTVKPDVEKFGREPIPNLESLFEQTEDQRKKVLFIMLESNEEIQSLPETQQLFAASIRYWIRYARPKKDYVNTLLFQFFHDKKSTLEPDQPKPRIDIGLLHSLAGWHSVMLEALNLNKILLDALPEPDLSQIYNGVIAHNIYKELTEEKPKVLIETIKMEEKREIEDIFEVVKEGLHLKK